MKTKRTKLNYTDGVHKEFPNAVFYEDDKYYYVDLKTGLGEALYPKATFTFSDVINDINS